MTPKEYPQNLHTPKNIRFSEHPPPQKKKKKLILKFKILNPIMTRAYVCMKISEYPPWAEHVTSHILANKSAAKSDYKWYKTLVQSVTTVVCFSLLIMFLGSLYCNQNGPRSDCSQGSRLIRVHSVCIHEKVLSELRLNICIRCKKQTCSIQKILAR